MRSGTVQSLKQELLSSDQSMSLQIRYFSFPCNHGRQAGSQEKPPNPSTRWWNCDKSTLSFPPDSANYCSTGFGFSFEFGNQWISRLNGVHFSNPIPYIKPPFEHVRRSSKAPHILGAPCLPCSESLWSVLAVRPALTRREQGIEQI